MILNSIFVFLVHFSISKFHSIIKIVQKRIELTGLFSIDAERAAAAANAAALLFAICCCKISLLGVDSSFLLDVR